MITHESKTVNFADVAHGTLIFSKSDPAESLILDLIDTKWVQRLRRVSQTGNTKFVYMFAEHSRFGHSLGVAYLANQLVKHLKAMHPEQVEEYELAIAAAAILHDIGHAAPGSHLAEQVWMTHSPISHEQLTQRIILEDPEIIALLAERDPSLPQLVNRILDEDQSLPPWVISIISGGAWNADRGNWSIVDSVMCAVSYGRYNITALIDAFRLSSEGELVLQESRLDALTHFFVARNSMYRQVYQHRVLQTADEMCRVLVQSVRERFLNDHTEIFADETMQLMLSSKNYAEDLSLHDVFLLDEPWWYYHLNRWCNCEVQPIQDLSTRLRDRHLFKTISVTEENRSSTLESARSVCNKLDLDPKIYCLLIEKKDTHKAKKEVAPRVLSESGKLLQAEEVEPLITLLAEGAGSPRKWIAVPKEVKQELGRLR